MRERMRADRMAHFIIFVVRCNFSDIPLDTTSTEHDARETIVKSLLRCHLSYIDCPLFPDSIASYDLLNLVYAGTELSCPMEDIIEKTVGEIERHSTGADVGSVKAGTRDSLVKLHQFLPLFETPEERSESTDVHGMSQNSH